jgi:hypothetical protein
MAMRSLSKNSSYIIVIGEKVDTLRVIGPFKRLIELNKFLSRNIGHPFFNPYKEEITICVQQDPKYYIKNSKDLFNSLIKNNNIVNIKNYKK